MRGFAKRFNGLPRPARVLLGFGVPALAGLLTLELRAIRGGLPAFAIWSALCVALVAGLHPLSQGRRLRIFFVASTGHLLAWGLLKLMSEHDVILGYASYDPVAFSKAAAISAAPFFLGLAWDLDHAGSEEWPSALAGLLLGLGLGPLLAGGMQPAYLAQLAAPVLMLGLASACLSPGSRWCLGFDCRAALRGLALLNLIALLEAWHGHRVPESWTWFFPSLRWLALAWSMAPGPAGRLWQRALPASILALSLGFGAKALGGGFPDLARALAPAALALGWSLASPGLPSLALALALGLLSPLFAQAAALLALGLSQTLLRECLFLPAAFSLSALPQALATYRWDRA
jgi:hypothetical protein